MKATWAFLFDNVLDNDRSDLCIVNFWSFSYIIKVSLSLHGPTYLKNKLKYRVRRSGKFKYFFVQHQLFFVDMKHSFVQHQHVFVDTRLLFVQHQTFTFNKKYFSFNTKLFFLTSFRLLCHSNIFLLSHSNKILITFQKIKKNPVMESFLINLFGWTLDLQLHWKKASTKDVYL